MTLIRKNAIIRKIKDITIGGTLMFALLGGSAMLQSCGSEDEGSELTHTKSVQTYIQEVQPNEFQITHEEVGEENQASQAYINYLNGTTKVLTIEEAQQLLSQQAPDTTVSMAQNQIDTVAKTSSTTKVSVPTNSTATNYNDNSTSHYQSHSGGSNLSTILFYSAMGNMLGRSHYQYAPPHFYHSPESYNRSFNANTTLKNSVSSRPRSSSSGFFGSSSRSRSVGS
ncbi:MAG: hypothetical protein EAZ08_04635 [Cytophagales bacterium]|nr:MAG: hypothetical protein EAZ08_04635 [Cytophagales bacterium]